MEILRVTPFAWTEPGRPPGTRTLVSWVDDKGGHHITVLEGEIRDRAKITRELRRLKRLRP